MQEVIREAETGNFDGVRQPCAKISCIQDTPSPEMHLCEFCLLCKAHVCDFPHFTVGTNEPCFVQEVYVFVLDVRMLQAALLIHPLLLAN